MIGDAPMNELGARRLLTNPDMLRWRDYIPDLDREKRFWRPTTVSVDDEFRVFVVDAARFRVQVYRKTFKELSSGQIDPVDTYTDPEDQLGVDRPWTGRQRFTLSPPRALRFVRLIYNPRDLTRFGRNLEAGDVQTAVAL